jgi:hypothetical protein
LDAAGIGEEQSKVSRAIVSVGTGEKYCSNLLRLKHSLLDFRGTLKFWRDELPPGSPPHADVPYAFKVWALKCAIDEGFEQILWLDSSIVVTRPLDRIWSLLDDRGYWFSKNFPHGPIAPSSLPWKCGQWCADSALGPLGISREVSLDIDLVIGGAFGLDVHRASSRRLFDELLRLARDGAAFRGSWDNEGGRASSSRIVLGHRHDQTVLSVLAWRQAMELTTPPDCIVDGARPSTNTVFEIVR